MEILLHPRRLGGIKNSTKGSPMYSSAVGEKVIRRTERERD